MGMGKGYFITDKTNAILGVLGALTVQVFGKYWMLPVIFLLEMVLDYITGWVLHKVFLKDENSNAGAQGAIRKVAYIICIAIAFLASYSIILAGEVTGVDLSFFMFFGWFTLATFMINEFRSILENISRMGVKVPVFLITGFEIASEKIDSTANSIVRKEKEDDEDK